MCSMSCLQKNPRLKNFCVNKYKNSYNKHMFRRGLVVLLKRLPSRLGSKSFRFMMLRKSFTLLKLKIGKSVLER